MLATAVRISKLVCSPKIQTEEINDSNAKNKSDGQICLVVLVSCWLAK